MRNIIVKTFIITAALMPLLLSVIAATAAAQPAETTGDPSARALYDGMLETFRNEKTIYLHGDYIWEVNGVPLSDIEYRLWLKKPGFARLEALDNETGLEAVLIIDGKNMWCWWPKGRPWLERETRENWERTKMTSYLKWDVSDGKHSIAHKTADLHLSMSMSIFEFSTFHGYTDIMLPYLDGVTSAGLDTLDGRTCEVIDLSFMEGQRLKKYWFPEGGKLPVRLEQEVRTNPSLRTVEVWSDIQTGQEISDSLFAWRPGEDWYEYREPVIEDGLVAVGVEAPDFDHKLFSGGSFRLSDHRGEVVWLVFWRVGCPPCRVEMPFLERMHEEHAGDGLTIVGFNCFDPRDVVEDFFTEYKTSYLTVLDSSAEAAETCRRRYQRIKGMTAVPLNYVIGRDGRVIDAWYGFDEKHGDEAWVKKLLSGAEDLDGVIAYLLGYVDDSGCTFIRNGKEYDCHRAKGHIERKYRHFRSKIETPEDFIRLSATKSEMSGKPYMVRTAGGRQLPCADWLLEALEEYRNGSDGGH